MVDFFEAKNRLISVTYVRFANRHICVCVCVYVVQCLCLCPSTKFLLCLAFTSLSSNKSTTSPFTTQTIARYCVLSRNEGITINIIIWHRNFSSSWSPSKIQCSYFLLIVSHSNNYRRWCFTCLCVLVQTLSQQIGKLIAHKHS